MSPVPTVRTAFVVGECACLTKLIYDEDVTRFAEITGDTNPVHLDADFAARTRFGGVIAHGILTAGLVSAVLGTLLPGPGGILLDQSIRYLRPVRVNDELTAEVRVTEWNPDRKRLRVVTRCTNQSGDEVLTGDATLMVEPLRQLP